MRSTKTSDPSAQIDAYIAKSAEFARPILKEIRRMFHQACPQIQETIKWGVPYFEHHGLVGGMAAFKHHASFGFWKAKQLSDPHGLLKGADQASMCALKFTSVSELPPKKILMAYIKEAAALNERAAKRPRSAKPASKKKVVRKLEVPDDLMKALRKNKKALATFTAFSYSNQKEYVEWVTEAKREETRARRISQAVTTMADGKPKNWKYMPR